MCGFASALSTNTSKVPTEALLQRMVDVLAHRGPDGEGVCVPERSDVHVGLGHRRLSIVDLAGGAQPMCNEDETVWITYNGEIYNHLELRSALEARGHRYRTRSDTETIVHAYEEWGTDCVHRLRGMFAFVIWDSRARRLFAARDRLGIKPFYYFNADGVLLCASETKALFAAGWHRPAINHAALPEHFAFGYAAGEQTLFEGVQALLPGHWLLWKDDRVSIRRYWEVPPCDNGDDRRSKADVVEEFRSLFEQSVQMRLMSDVPLGVFLSGGLDSSAIAATMARQVSGRLKTFSVGFEGHNGDYSELGFARELAESIGADHHEVVVNAEDYFGSLPKLIWHEDKPIRFPASVPLYHVAALAADHVKVVLTGEGSDETLAGYDRYWAILFNQRWAPAYERAVPGWLRERWLRRSFWGWPLPHGLKRKISHTFVNHSRRPEQLVFDNFYAIFPGRVQGQLFAPETRRVLQGVDPYAETMHLYAGRDGDDRLDRLLYTDQKTYLLELLMKQDRMSMAASIESRVPFLEHELVEFAARVPARFKLCGHNGKVLLRRAMQDVLPKSVLARKKMGFPVPVGPWLRGEFYSRARSLLSDERTRSRGIFNPDFVNGLLAAHRSGRRNQADALWSLLNFELWARIFIDGDDHQQVASEFMAGDQADAETGTAVAGST